MTDIAIETHEPAKARPAWRRTLRWTLGLAVFYAAGLSVARFIVAFQFGGVFFTPYFAVVLFGSLFLVLALWPVLAVTASDPQRGDAIKSVLQWTVIGAFVAALLYVFGQGLDDGDIKLIGNYVGKDLVMTSSAPLHR
jgi:Trk-type K+ transport system membrane component